MSGKMKWEFNGRYISVASEGKALITGIKPGYCINGKWVQVPELILAQGGIPYGDSLGTGNAIVLDAAAGIPDARLMLINYEDGKLGFRMTLTNNTASAVILGKYSPFMTCRYEGGVFLEGHPAEWRLYSDTGGCGGICGSFGFTEKGGEHESTGVSVVWSPASDESFAVGQVEVERTMTKIVYKYGENNRVITTTLNEVRHYWADHGNIHIMLVQDAEDYRLDPGESLDLDLCMIYFDDSPFRALETFADNIVKFNNVKKFTNDDIWVGWMTWYNQEAHIRGGYGCTRYECASEEVTLEQSRFINDNGLKSYGVRDIMIDDGYQKRVHLGDWLEATHKFPSGMDGLADELQKLGMRPGIWLTPFAATEDSDVFRKHPEWFVKDKNENVFSPWDWYHANPPVHAYEMDTTAPGAIDWVIDVFRTFRKWGYYSFKNDFSGGLIWSDGKSFYNKKMTGLMRWRWTWRKIKEALGETDCSLQLCGANNIGAVGIVDNVRTGCDIGGGVSDNQWRAIRTDSATANINRWWQNKRFYIIDADNLEVAEYKDYRRYENVNEYRHKIALSYDEARVRAVMVFATGGNIILGDRLNLLEPERIDIIKKVLPVFGEASIPLDMFKRTVPYIFWNHIVKPWGEWELVSIINYEESSLVEEIPVRHLGLNSGGKYAVIELWSENEADVIKNGILRAVVKPHSVKTYRIAKLDMNLPVLLGSTFHITMGGVEIKEYEYIGNTQLRVVVTRPENETGKCFFWSPEQGRVIGITVKAGPEGEELLVR